MADEVRGRVIDRTEIGRRKALHENRLGESFGRECGERGIGLGECLRELPPEFGAGQCGPGRELGRAVAVIVAESQRHDDPLSHVPRHVEQLRLDAVGTKHIGQRKFRVSELPQAVLDLDDRVKQLIAGFGEKQRRRRRVDGLDPGLANFQRHGGTSRGLIHERSVQDESLVCTPGKLNDCFDYGEIAGGCHAGSLAECRERPGSGYALPGRHRILLRTGTASLMVGGVRVIGVE